MPKLLSETSLQQPFLYIIFRLSSTTSFFFIHQFASTLEYSCFGLYLFEYLQNHQNGSSIQSPKIHRFYGEGHDQVCIRINQNVAELISNSKSEDIASIFCLINKKICSKSHKKEGKPKYRIEQVVIEYQMYPPCDSNASNFSVFDAHMECRLKVQEGSISVLMIASKQRIKHPLANVI